MNFKMLLLVCWVFLACQPKETKPGQDDYFLKASIDGKSFTFNSDELLTSYYAFGGNQREFRIYATKENGLSLTLTITNDMKGPSSTPSGSKEAGNQLFQGSVSLQDYPGEGYTFNNYDGFLNPKPEPVPDAILITESKPASDGKAYIISGTINTTVLAGENKQNDPNIKDRKIVGEFRIRHELNGTPF